MSPGEVRLLPVPAAPAVADPPLTWVDPFEPMPAAPAGTVWREYLLRWLETLDDRISLLTVRAPAGYGKTTLLRQWAGRSGRPFVHLSLRPEHADPLRLRGELARAVAGRAAGTSALAHRSVGGLATAVNELGRAVVVLDDAHHLRGNQAPALVTEFAARLRPGTLLVVCGRTTPRLRLSRLRGEGRCAELGAPRLGLTRQEARILLQGNGITLPERALDEFLERTGGWPAGVSLAARGGTGPAGEPVNTFVEDYVRDEVLSELPGGLRRFLAGSAALERLTPSLCDATLGTHTSARWLWLLRERDLVLPDDREDGPWYRYQPWLAWALLREQRRDDPGAHRSIHRRAAQWYERHGDFEQAVCYALAGQDPDAAARLIETHGQRLADEGRVDVVRAWLPRLDGEQLRRRPGLAALAAWVWALTGDAPKALAALRLLDAVQPGAPDADGWVASARARVQAALAVDGIAEMLLDARRWVRLEPPGSPWHSMAAAHLGTAHLLSGAQGPALRALVRAVRYGGSRQRPAAALALAQLSLLAAERGQWATAASCARDARSLVAGEGLEEYPVTLLVHVACARVAAHRGDGREAWNEVRRALRLLRRPSPAAPAWLAAQASVTIGWILLELDDRPGALRMVSEAERHLASLLDEGPVLRRRYSGLRAELLGTDVTGPTTRPIGLTTAELRVLHLLPTHLSLEEIAQGLSISRNTVKSQVAAVYRKLQADRRAEAVRTARELGLLDRLG